MFENPSLSACQAYFDRLTKAGRAESEDDVKTALREVRIALLEADVSPARGARFHQRDAGKSYWSGSHQIGHTGPASGQDCA